MSLLGHECVLVALIAALFGGITGVVSGYRRSATGLRWTYGAVYLFAFSMLAANGVMIRALLTHDFSVSYVAQVGSRATPTWITVVSLWSSLEGSILFWGAILGMYSAAFAYSNRRQFTETMGYALGTIMLIAGFFAFLIAAPADPFVALSPVPADGPGPNPLLQNHLLMAIHPPMLYLGYVGMTIPFGIAVAALARGQLTDGWLKCLRRWTMVPWTFLSVGIVLGGWWAYEVLGWGGYWAWDPVENASFLPWLAATAYIHSTMVQERRQILKAWTLTLVMCAFLLTILGTFMTRSGVFNSVHSFTQSSIGPMFLGFLAVVLVVSIGLLASRSHLLRDDGTISAVMSRESAFLLNNVVFVLFTFTVLLGTVFPLVSEAVRGVQVSVGEPYFNRMAVPIGLMLVFLMGVGPVLPWGKPTVQGLLRDLALPVACGVLVAVACLIAGLREGLTILTFALCGFALIVTLREMIWPAFQRAHARGDGIAPALWRHITGNRRRMGGYVVHLAIIAIVTAIAASQTYRQTGEASLAKGDKFSLGDYTFTYLEPVVENAPHRFTVVARLAVTKGDQSLGVIMPKLNFYPSQREPIGTPHVLTIGGMTDVYVSLLSVDPNEASGQRIGVKAFIMPLVPWIWGSLPILVLGSLIGLWPRRRQQS